jgi:hypothetical protein
MFKGPRNTRFPIRACEVCVLLKNVWDEETQSLIPCPNCKGKGTVSNRNITQVKLRKKPSC